jgi:predicted RNase H-like HicB family nuclease
MQLKVVITKGEDGWYVVTVPSLPGCISQGKTIKEAKQNIREAIALYLDLKKILSWQRGVRHRGCCLKRLSAIKFS